MGLKALVYVIHVHACVYKGGQNIVREKCALCAHLQVYIVHNVYFRNNPKLQLKPRRDDYDDD